MVTEAIAMPRRKTPNEPGLYFARHSDKDTSWTLIVKIQGQVPYLTWIAWEIGKKGTDNGEGAPPYYFQNAPISVPEVPKKDVM